MDAPAGTAPPPDAALDDADEVPVGVPPVVAVVVTSDAGPWLEEALTALAEQDYPNLSVLVVDAASSQDPTPRIATAMPSAYVRRLSENPGFAAAANEVIGVVEGASHFVFLHDDAAPDPDAVRLMVEEAFRSNAGVVSPKLVEWDDPLRLLGVGASADKAGVVRPYGRHELDQEQHDSVRDVFVAPGGCTLVRADLFETLGGFDPGVPLFGEDLDLSWRAQLLGARVVVAPGARVRHREASIRGERPLVLGETTGDLPERIARLQLRHRLRAVLKNYSPIHLVRVVPQLVVLMLAEAMAALFGGRRRLALAVADAWRWNLGRRSGLRASRRQTQRRRILRDREVRRLQTRGSVRLSAALQGGIAAEERTLGFGAAGRQLAGAVATGGTRSTVAVWTAIAIVLLVGTRRLLTGSIGAVGDLAAFPGSPMTMLRLFVSGWRTSGLGGEAPAPPAFAFLGLGGLALFGGMGLLQKVLVLGMLPLGIVGAHRMTAPLGSWRARLVGVALYAAVPLPYDALATGRWRGLIAYAASPWLLLRLLRATGLAPFGAPAEDEVPRHRRRSRPSRPSLRRHPSESLEELLGAEAGTMDPIDTEEFRVAVTALSGRHDEHEGAPDNLDGLVDAPPAIPAWVRRPGRLGHQVVTLAIFLAVAGAFVPSLAAAAIVAALGLLAGGLLVGGLRPSARPIVVAGGAAVGAAVLLLPWSIEVLAPGATWAGFAGLGRTAADAPGLGELVRFGTGPTGGSPLGWAFLVAAALPLIVGRGWRLTWAARLWVVAGGLWAVAWVAGRGWLGVPPPALDVLLAPAAAAIVLAAVLGLSAFEIDLPGYRFGWRQIAALTAAAAATVALLPVIGAAVEGGWRQPRRDFARLLSWMPERRADGDFRVLWAGRPETLPLDGWRLDDGLAYGSSRGGVPSVVDLWPASDQGSSGLLADALDVARRGETSRLGHLLAPLGVRYIAVPLAIGPGAHHPARPADVTAALRAQIDLKLISTDAALVVYENAAWAPTREVVPAGAVAASRRAGADAARTTELVGAAPALRTVHSATGFGGAVPAAGEVLFSESYSSRWRLVAHGVNAPHRKAFGWANAFTVRRAGRASLEYRTSPLRYLALLLELGLWVAAIRLALQGLRARREAGS